MFAHFFIIYFFIKKIKLKRNVQEKEINARLEKVVNFRSLNTAFVLLTIVKWKLLSRI